MYGGASYLEKQDFIIMNKKKSIEEKQAVPDGLVMKIEDVNAVIEKANYIDGGNFKARIGNTTYLVGVFFNKAKKVTIEDRMKNLICQEVTAGNF